VLWEEDKVGMNIISEKLEDIWNYLNIEVHPVVSPDRWDVYSTLCDMVDNIITLLKEQEPIEARLHLCESCKKQFPECEVTEDNVVFGSGKGNDNIIGCSAYDNRWMSQNELRVLALDEIHSGMTVWLEDEDKTDVILAIVVVPDGICRCFITADNRRISPSNNDYCVRWRAWTSEPTDEQRKAVKWDD
jgi:hypothetical protein